MSHPVYAASKSPSTLRHKVMFVLLVDRHFAGSCRPLLALTICHLSRAGGRLSPDSRPANPSNRRRTRGRHLTVRNWRNRVVPRACALAQRGKRTRENVGCAGAATIASNWRVLRERFLPENACCGRALLVIVRATVG